LNTDTYIERLAAHTRFVERLHLEIQQADPDISSFIAEYSKEQPCPDENGSFPNPKNTLEAVRDSILFRQLLEADREIYPDTEQMIILLQTILQNSPTGLAVVSGPEVAFRVVNSAYRSLLPDPGVEIVGHNFSEIWPVELGIDGEQLIQDVLKRGKSLHFDRLELRYPDGLNHSFSLRICRMKWLKEEGALLLMHETTQADRARQLAMEIAEETYHQAKELDAIVEAMVDTVILLDHRGKVMRANRATTSLLGFNPLGYDMVILAKVLGTRYLDGSPVPAGDLPFERALKGEIVAGEHLSIENDNGERIVRISASPLFHETVVTGVITVWHDVTERERLLEQLEIEQSRLETIIENAPEAIIVADEEGRIVLGNPAAEWIFGRRLPYQQDFESHVDLSICYTDNTPYDPRNLPLTCSALDGERLNNIEMQVRLPGGEVRHVVASTAPIVDRKGNLNGAVGVFQDITQRKRAEEILRLQATRSQLLANLTQEFAEAGLNWHDLLNTIVDHVGKSLGDLCSLHLLSESQQEQYLAAVYVEDEEGKNFIRNNLLGIRFPADQGMVGSVIRTGLPLVLSEVPIAEIQMSTPNTDWSTANFTLPQSVSVLMVPLRAHGRWIGIINLMRFQPENHYQEDERIFLQDLAERVSLAIENARLYEREAQRARELQALHQAATALLSTIDLETLLSEILSAAHAAIPAAQRGIVYLLSEQTGQMEIRATYGCDEYGGYCIKMQRHAAEAVSEKRSLLINASDGMKEDSQALDASSAIVAPLMQPQKVFGALVLFGTQPELFSVNDLHLLDSFAATATAALQNATLYAEVQWLATTDMLTEQFNRRRFLELSALEIFRSRRFATPLSAIMFDLDNFKEINDTLGHAAGDYVLKTVAQRCRATIRVIDILGRYGGDEFAVLLPNADIVEAQEIAERIRQSVTGHPISTGRGDLSISISLGVAQVDHTNDTLASLLGRADSALYQAKQKGRNQVAQA
jgi:diguanylate cyclase (GGDEF)-like protein/PAS domain S-box-containing protein